MIKNKFNYLRITLMSAILAACGGGGVNTTASTSPITPSNPGITPSNLQMTVPKPTYAAGSAELLAFNQINNLRQSMGMGLWAQNAALDKSTQNHAAYVTYNKAFGHYEDAGKPGFTGYDAMARANFVSYGGGAGEVMSFTTANLSPVVILTNTVYHRSGLLDQGAKDVGIAATTYMNAIVIDYGYRFPGQNQASDYVGHYPLSDQTGVPRFMYLETPVPLVGLPLDSSGSPDTNNYTTSPVSIHAAAGTTLTVGSIVVTAAGSNAPLDMTILTAQNDPNKLIPSHEAYAVGKAPFLANTTYTVTANVAINGKSTMLTWSFTTGS